MENQPQQNPNTFAQMERENTERKNEGVVTESYRQPVSSQGEMDFNDFSDTAVGDKVKYNRPVLDGKEDVVENLQVFPVDETQEPGVSANGKSKFWMNKVVLTYASKNADGVNNREYISGARTFRQDNGDKSEVSFWYPGADNQSAKLWELVASHKGKEPKDLSPREFVAFWKNRPKIRIKAIEVKNLNTREANAPRFIKKNLPGEILS